MSVNKAILIGRLGADPEEVCFDHGGKMSKFSLATSDRHTKKNGEKVHTTEWHNIVCFGKVAEIALDFLSKGVLCYVEGKIRYKNWEDDNGNKRNSTEIAVNVVRRLEKRPDTAGQPHTNYDNNGNSYNNEDDML